MKTLCDSELTDDYVSEATTIPMVNEQYMNNKRWWYYNTKIINNRPTIAPTNVIVNDHDCCVWDGDTQSMSFVLLENEPLLPFYNLNAPLEDYFIVNHRK